MDEEKEPKEGFSFLQETIKDDKGRRRSFPKIIFMMAVLGVIFGITASTSFVVVKPWLESIFEVKETVTIPSDEEADTSEEVDESTEGLTEEHVDENIDDAIDDAMEGVKEEILEGLTEEAESTDSEIVSYEKIYEELYAVAEEASKSTVTVRVEYDSAEEEALVLETLEGEDTESVRSVTGLIVASTSSEILVLTPSSILEDAEKIYVKFNDGTEVLAEVKAEETILGYAVLRMSATQVSDDIYETAVLGNSLVVKQGAVAIAIGNQFDYEDGLGYGVISSTKNQLNLVDGTYDLISTDIPVAVEGTGILINTSGQVIGLINTQLTDETAVDALGISQLKTIIEELSNGNEIPYIGIKGIAITDEIAEQQSMPLGIYVQEVEMNSPAMYAGIRNGDIITAMNDITVITTTAYRNQLLKLTQDDIVTICIQRKGTSEYVEMEIQVTVGSRD